MDTLTHFQPFEIIKHLKLFYSIQHELFDLLEEQSMIYPLETRKAQARHGSIKFPDAYVLKKLLDKYKPNSILEVGGFLGFSTRWFLEISSKWNAKVTTIDPNLRCLIFDNPKWYLEKLISNFYPDKLEIIKAFFGRYESNINKRYERFEPKRDKDYIEKLIR